MSIRTQLGYGFQLEPYESFSDVFNMEAYENRVAEGLQAFLVDKYGDSEEVIRRFEASLKPISEIELELMMGTNFDEMNLEQIVRLYEDRTTHEKFFVIGESHAQWHLRVRENSPIDLFEAQQGKSSTPITFKYLHIDISSGAGYINQKTGQRVDTRFVRDARVLHSISPEVFGRHTLKHTGTAFDTLEDFTHFVTPAIPDNVTEVLDWLKLFKQSDTLNRLRPVIITDTQDNKE